MSNLVNTTKAYREFIKAGNFVSSLRQIDNFFRSGVLKSISEIQIPSEPQKKFFDFFSNPHSLEEVAQEFNFTNKSLLEELLVTLVHDNYLSIIKNHENITFLIGNKNNYLIDRKIPVLFDDFNVQYWDSYAEDLPNALKSQFKPFTGGFSRLNWQGALETALFRRIAMSAFLFSSLLQRTGKILNVMCGNGIYTSMIFLHHLKNNMLKNVELEGIDTDKTLVNVARNSFIPISERTTLLMFSSKKVQKELALLETLTPVEAENKYKEILLKLPQELKSLMNNIKEQSLPSFQHVESLLQLPYADNSFQAIYCCPFSIQTTNYHKLYSELYRILAKGGILVSHMPFRKHLLNDVTAKYERDAYWQLLFHSLKDSEGFAIKKDFLALTDSLHINKKQIKYSRGLYLLVIQK